jgi:hypothetical protein
LCLLGEQSGNTVSLEKSWGLTLHKWLLTCVSFPDEEDRIQDPEGELDGALHQQGRDQEAPLLALGLQVHHHVCGGHRHQVLQGGVSVVS